MVSIEDFCGCHDFNVVFVWDFNIFCQICMVAYKAPNICVDQEIGFAHLKIHFLLGYILTLTVEFEVFFDQLVTQELV